MTPTDLRALTAAGLLARAVDAEQGDGGGVMPRPRCITHHHACDCREWDHAREIERLTTEIGRLREAFRVNALVLRPGTTDAEIARVLYPEPVSNPD